MTNWKRICTTSDVPMLGARMVASEDHGLIALFRNGDNAFFALRDKCPHKGGPLSQGIVHGTTVTCPLHGWKVQLEDGQVVPPDAGCVKRYAVKVEHGDVFIDL